MQFKTLKISQWQQFESIELHIHDRLTILTGANGSGKTTLLNLFAKHFGWQSISLATPKHDKTGLRGQGLRGQVLQNQRASGSGLAKSHYTFYNFFYGKTNTYRIIRRIVPCHLAWRQARGHLLF